MKKVLSVAMASAMVLGMGANAFAIQYSTGSSDTAAWPKGFQFDGSLFVTDEDGDIVTSTITDLNGKTRVDFMPGDTIWMPLYANNQKVYTVDGYQKGYDKVEATTISLTPVLENAVEGQILVNHLGDVMPFTYEDNVNKVVYYYNQAKPAVADGWRAVEIEKPNFVFTKDGKVVKATDIYTTAKDVTEDAYSDLYVKYDTDSTGKITKVYTFNGTPETEYTAAGILPNVYDYYTAGVSTAPDKAKTFTDGEIKDLIYKQVGAANLDVNENKETVVLNNVLVGTNTDDEVVVASGVKVQVSLPEVAAVKENLGTTVGVNGEETVQNFVNTVAYGHYTGNIDKNWSINLIEEDNGVADLIDHAELYKADEVDYLSYKDYTTEIMPNAVYLKVELKDTWKLAKDADLKYYVYVADNDSGKETNKVWVSGTYGASFEYVDFTWTNDASQPTVWKVKDGENGVAVFDFADKAFFQVKMYSKESMYLDLSTAYDAAMAGDFDEADAFYAFDNENANFSRTGTLILVSDDASLVPYQVTEDGYVKVDAEYVEDFVIAHTNEKVDGFVFETKELGNYVLSTEEVEVEEVEEDNTQEVVVPDDDNKETNNNSKPNPSTGAEDFVGLAVSLAVVSVAAAGALALKK